MKLLILVLFTAIGASAQIGFKGNYGTPVTAGLVFYLPGNADTFNAAGLPVDVAGGNTVTAGNLTKTNLVSGVVQQSLYFNANNYVTYANSANLQIGGPLTICFWSNISASQFGPLVSKESGGGANSSYYMGVNTANGGSYYFGFNSGGNEINYVYSATVYNAWVHCCGVYDGTNLKLFLNGTLVMTGGNSGAPNVNTAPLNIGTYIFTGNYFGKADDIRIYNRALSAAEITNLFQFGWGAHAGTPTHP